MSIIISQSPTVGEKVFDAFNYVFYFIGLPMDSASYSYECWLYSPSLSSFSYAYNAIMISLSEPLSKILLVFVVWVIKRFFRISAIKNRYFIISITSIILIEQLGVIKILLGAFMCIDVGGGGSFMQRNPNVSCNTSTYAYYAAYVFAPMLILWAGGFTLILFFYICSNKVR